MPIYEYKCRECGQTAEFILRNVSDSGSLSCPNCGNHNLERLLSVPSIIKSNSASPGTTCCGRTERCEVPPCTTDEKCRRI